MTHLSFLITPALKEMLDELVLRTGFPLEELFVRSMALYLSVLNGRRDGLEPALIDPEGFPRIRLNGLTEEG